ncbi:hypothetical protein CspHIS471_0605000 [Cutaneotrichosporon sp. HIS471]|nr:hypothetical protein CspHIS471_0605000 [Cutaneotrichosporon sp. HIS471]
MSEVRQRKTAAAAAAAQAPKYDRAARPPKRPTRSAHWAISVVLLAFLVLYAKRNGLTKSQAPWTADGGDKPLPGWYAVCSREGKKVYTVPVEGGVGAVQCVVVEGKRVRETGSLQAVRRAYGEKGSSSTPVPKSAPEAVRKTSGIRILYLPPGHSLTPGFTDAHAHPLEYGASRHLQLLGSGSVGEVVRRTEAYVQSRGRASFDDQNWVVGQAWDQELWPGKEYAIANDLDTPTLQGLHIVLHRTDLHAAWVSSAVLEAIGPIPQEDIEGGQVIRDSEGRPTGVFLDNAIREYVGRVMPPMTDTQREANLEVAMRDALSLGLTGIHDAGLVPDDLAFFRRMAEEDKLRLRFYTMLLCPEPRDVYCGNQVERVTGLQDGRWTLQSVKLFGDGALGSRGAALLEDYSDAEGWRGFLLTQDHVWAPLIKKYYDEGWQVNVHCIGDKANHVVLDAIEAAIGDDKEAGRARRLRIEHAQIFTQDDIKRAAALGVIGSYQPTHATSDMWYAESRLGPDRIKGAYAWRTYLDSGGRIALGSDFPVESPDPLKGFYAAVTRRAEDGTSPHGSGGWYPNEKLTRVEALRGFTADAAFAAFSEDTGSLTKGMRFDAVLWDDDLMEVEEDEMLRTKVRATILDGRIVYGEWAV